MSTTNIAPKVDVEATMRYTELGEGDKFRDNVMHGTDRIAGQLGDKLSREDFIRYCQDKRAQNSQREIEGYELRVSWSPDELSVDSEEDIQQAIDHTYLLCKEVAPDSLCWVTAHTDSEGGCVHTHAVIANHNESTGKALSHGMTHTRVVAINDELSRAHGMDVIGPSKESGKTWNERRRECNSFERELGDRVKRARDKSSDIDTFRTHLEDEDVLLVERTKKDDEGVEHTGWTYKMREPGGGRMRRRKASNLCSEFTKDATEAYFTEKQAQTSAPTHVQPEEQEEQDEHYMLFDSYFLDKDDVRDNLAALDDVTADNQSLNDMVKARMDEPSEFLLDVQTDVDKARAEFKAAKDYRDSMRREKAPSLMALRGMFGMMSAWSDDPVQRMFDLMMERMMAMLAAEALRREQQREQEEAERRLYEARRQMWDAEKRQKEAERAYGELLADDQFSQFREPEATVEVEMPVEKPVETVQEPVKAEESKRHRVLPSEFEDLEAQEQAESVSLDGLSRRRDDPGE